MLVARALKNSQLTSGERHAYFGDRTPARKANTVSGIRRVIANQQSQDRPRAKRGLVMAKAWKALQTCREELFALKTWNWP